VEPVSLAFIVGLAILAAVAAAFALARGASLARIREGLGLAPEADLEAAVRAAVDERDRARWDATQADLDLAYLADLIGVGVVRLGDDLVVRLANRAATSFLGRPPGGLSGRTAIEAFADHRLEEAVGRARDTGFGEAETAGHDPAGRVLILRARRSPIEGIWVTIDDVSELRRLQRIRAEFIDNLAHELRTPLANVRLLAETLSRDSEQADLPARLRRRVAQIDVESGHLTQMVNELLDLSRIEQGTAALELEEVPLTPIVAGTLDRLHLFAEAQGVTLVSVVPGSLPSMRADPERIGQVLMNLLHNAVKFSPAGGRVVVRAEAGPDQIVVSARDQGIGIPERELERIFERFYKVDRARVRGKGGTGLGLAIARHIVEGHGGRIWAESEEGAGSTFSFTVPRASPAGVRGDRPRAGAGAGPGSSATG
jgi:two-component system, OmpR family, phosphate regulon sensor histidine kinase PhoR